MTLPASGRQGGEWSAAATTQRRGLQMLQAGVNERRRSSLLLAAAHQGGHGGRRSGAAEARERTLLRAARQSVLRRLAQPPDSHAHAHTHIYGDTATHTSNTGRSEHTKNTHDNPQQPDTKKCTHTKPIQSRKAGPRQPDLLLQRLNVLHQLLAAALKQQVAVGEPRGVAQANQLKGLGQLHGTNSRQRQNLGTKLLSSSTTKVAPVAHTLCPLTQRVASPTGAQKTCLCGPGNLPNGGNVLCMQRGSVSNPNRHACMQQLQQQQKGPGSHQGDAVECAHDRARQPQHNNAACSVYNDRRLVLNAIPLRRQRAARARSVLIAGDSQRCKPRHLMGCFKAKHAGQCLATKLELRVDSNLNYGGTEAGVRRSAALAAVCCQP